MVTDFSKSDLSYYSDYLPGCQVDEEMPRDRRNHVDDEMYAPHAR